MPNDYTKICGSGAYYDRVWATCMKDSVIFPRITGRHGVVASPSSGACEEHFSYHVLDMRERQKRYGWQSVVWFYTKTKKRVPQEVIEAELVMYALAKV